MSDVYLLSFLQGDIETKIGLFDTLEASQAFVQQLAGYTSEDLYEYLEPSALRPALVC